MFKGVGINVEFGIKGTFQGFLLYILIVIISICSRINEERTFSLNYYLVLDLKFVKVVFKNDKQKKDTKKFIYFKNIKLYLKQNL